MEAQHLSEMCLTRDPGIEKKVFVENQKNLSKEF